MEPLLDTLILLGMLEGRGIDLLVAHVIEHLMILYLPLQNHVLLILRGWHLSELFSLLLLGR